MGTPGDRGEHGRGEGTRGTLGLWEQRLGMGTRGHQEKGQQGLWGHRETGNGALGQGYQRTLRLEAAGPQGHQVQGSLGQRAPAVGRPWAAVLVRQLSRTTALPAPCLVLVVECGDLGPWLGAVLRG